MRLALLVLLVLSSCDNTLGTVSLSLRSAPDDPLVEQIERAELTLPATGETFSASRGPSGQLRIAFDVEASTVQTPVLFSGYDDRGELIAVGRTPSIPLGGLEIDITIFVAPPWSVSDSGVTLPPATDSASIAYGGAAFFFGGVLDGETRDLAYYYSSVSHTVRLIEPLIEARSGQAVVASSDGIALFGGRDSAGEDTGALWLYEATTDRYRATQGNPDLVRSGAQAALLSRSTAVVTGDPWITVDTASLFASPRDQAAQGQAASALRGSIYSGLVLGQEQAFTISAASLSPIEAPPPEALRSGHGLAATGEMTLVVGGEASGQLQADILSYDTVAGSFSVAGTLATPRRDAGVAVTSDMLAVVGGVSAGDEVLGSVELFDPLTLEPIASLELLVPRTQPRVHVLGSAQILVAGGLDEGGIPVELAELITPR